MEARKEQKRTTYDISLHPLFPCAEKLESRQSLLLLLVPISLILSLFLSLKKASLCL
jgi:hypothetical protein